MSTKLRQLAPLSCACALALGLASQGTSASMIGFDFGGGGVPANWHSAAFGGTSLTNATDTTGAATEIDVDISPYTQLFSAPAPNPDTLPNYAYDLSGLDGFAIDQSLTITFSDLPAQQWVGVWLFAFYDFQFGVGGRSFDARVSGLEDTLVNVFLPGNVNDNLLVINDELGSPQRTLPTYLLPVQASETGTLTITFENSTLPFNDIGLGGASLMILPTPTSLALFAIGSLAGIGTMRRRRIAAPAAS